GLCGRCVGPCRVCPCGQCTSIAGVCGAKAFDHRGTEYTERTRKAREWVIGSGEARSRTDPSDPHGWRGREQKCATGALACAWGPLETRAQPRGAGPHGSVVPFSFSVLFVPLWYIACSACGVRQQGIARVIGHEQDAAAAHIAVVEDGPRARLG